MNLFVTGGTGLIGQEFCKQSFSQGNSITAISRQTGIDKVFRYAKLINVNDLADVRKEDIQDHDVLVHLAAEGVDQTVKKNTQSLVNTNLINSIQLIEKAISAGIKRILICGSCFEYGRSAEIALKPVTVSDPLLPTNIYAASKAAFSTFCIGMAFHYKISLTILRPFHVYGENESPNRLYPSLLKASMNNNDFSLTKGDQLRDFTNVTTIAELILKETNDIFLTKEARLIIKNLGTGSPMTVKDFTLKLWKKNRAKGKLLFGNLPYRENEIMKYVPDINYFIADSIA